MKFLPRTLAGQLLALLLLALVVAHVVAVLLLAWLRSDGDEVHPLWAQSNKTRVVSVYRTVVSHPAAAEGLLEHINQPESRFRIRAASADDATAPSPQEDALAQGLRQRLGLPADVPIKVGLRPRAPADADLALPDEDEHDRVLHIDVRLPDGRWLTSSHVPTLLLSHWRRVLSFSVPVGVLPIVVIAIFFGRRIMRPLRTLTEAAKRISRGERSAHLPLAGPEGVREIIEAFNEMQDRLLGVVNDRTRMVAAIGHDLRTPLTSLRIRAELVDDDELRHAMVATLNEMNTMVEEILHFAQDDAMRETTQHVEMGLLVSEVIEQQRVLGRDVAWSPPQALPYRCRPAHLKRALANLIDNSARYGRVQVQMALSANRVLRIEVNDEGPGIPPDQIEQAFQPFSRLEMARSGETGGFGLGLAIARSCVRAHGGELRLHNRPEGGLRAVVELPA
ncbi:ATP-binding protein [Paracidovorax anthurii]|uniref:histidine kinase n=1 Tax=Paracidovorax anthurii TaxID=78229 RepID=A0A328YY79_9BURK|nr:ATP-binding protein [Paracidovorax anthurii]RAR78908.1 signal transduction histidine kinase [Paracidovorax anthurii]